ncbi:MAG: XRE family transcriptional regulator [Spartobacteria bacterium]|nr:XRE family transcriptional regulator [Spartobacteria bacterium]
MDGKNSIGLKIEKCRTSRKLTLEDLSERSGCSVELITCIERGELVPSLTPLLKIARGLGVRLGTFLDDEVKPGPILARSNEYQNVIRFSGNAAKSERSTLEFFALAADKNDRHMEPFVIDVHPSEAASALSSHEGEEFLYVLQGVIEVVYGKERYRVESGDSIYYDSIVPHEVRAADGLDARILAVVYAPA